MPNPVWSLPEYNTNPVWTPMTFPPINTSGSNSNVKVITTQGGVNVSSGQTTLDKILATALSLAALAKGAGYVPTTEQPQNQYQSYYPAGYNPNIPVVASDGNTNALGSIEEWVKANTTIVLIGGAIGVAYLMKSPRSSKR